MADVVVSIEGLVSGGEPRPKLSLRSGDVLVFNHNFHRLYVIRSEADTMRLVGFAFRGRADFVPLDGLSGGDFLYLAHLLAEVSGLTTERLATTELLEIGTLLIPYPYNKGLTAVRLK